MMRAAELVAKFAPEAPADAVELAERELLSGTARGAVVISEDGRVVAGAARVLAAERLGLDLLPVRMLGQSGAEARPLRRRRERGVDSRSGCEGIVGQTVWRPAVFSRHDVSWIACRAWRCRTRKRDVAAFREAKRSAPEPLLRSASEELAVVIRRLFGGLEGWRVTNIACGNSGTEECFGKRLARAVASELGLDHVQLFGDRVVEGGSSHPRRAGRIEPLELIGEARGPVLVVDDVATSGWHVEEALGLLRWRGVSPSAAAVWISGDVA
jgi:hypothetical protein